jgi:peptide deformylase
MKNSFGVGVKIVQKGNEILRKTAKEVPLENIKSAEIRNIIKKMKQSIAENEEAVAIAAPQIGKSLRIFVISGYVFSPENKEKRKTDYGYLVFINPKILKKSHEQKTFIEGCLSVGGVYGEIKRSGKIKVEAYNENGKKFIKSGSGLFAQAIQHEMDHLDGVLFIDKAIMLKKYEQPKG